MDREFFCGVERPKVNPSLVKQWGKTGDQEKSQKVFTRKKEKKVKYKINKV